MPLTNTSKEKVDHVADINTTKLSWNLVVGVVRLYEIPSSWNPSDVCNIELVLQDEMDDGEPLILVAQLFKANQDLNEINVQNSLYASRMFLNPNFPDVVAFKNQYQLIVVITDGTGCINIMLWNEAVKMILGKTANDIRDLMRHVNGNAYMKTFEPIIDRKFLFKLSISHKNLTSVDQAYNAIKISDDKCVEQAFSNVVPASENHDLNSNGKGAAIVSLSKDSRIESIFENGLDTSAKCVIADSAPRLGVSGLMSPEGQGSSNKTFKHDSIKRKIE
ncbi:hypothetical protein Ahy_B04g071419 [Arachis hypogaea]|uniref:Replication factor A C-terminal domain-containing protein n=1 Tax=Arachis hypogaea TaxID=3818 RepID=A0A444ZKN5_ARAHY|nr:hypothetical protein Ahy_B04g071419 [Arachis hypogaea]